MIPTPSDTQSLQWISREYFEEMNGTRCDILNETPTALQFSRMAHISRPVVIKNVKVPALGLWTNQYLVDRMGERTISVAVTPDGRADAVTSGPNQKLYFVEPHVQQMTMASFLSTLSEDNYNSGEVHYLQSQNGNVYSSSRNDSEFEPLRSDVPREILWCSEAFDKTPDAVNLWIGDNRSVTSIHSDPYENIYTVLRGTKHFTLLPPTEGWFLRECSYPHAAYTRLTPSSNLTITPSPPTTPPIRWSSISDPHLPSTFSSEVHPIHITLNAGDTLYLPAGWWHHVRQSGGITIALNWWYDMEVLGMAWVWLSFLRGIRDVPASFDSEGQLED